MLVDLLRCTENRYSTIHL